jgi:hypothetical protein
VNILRNNITTVQQACSHILSVSWVALHHLVVGLEARHRDLLHRVGLVRSLGGRDNWSVCNEREVDSWIRDQVGLELIEIDVKGSIETEGSGDGRDNYLYS